jgi:hypothetical protein
MALPVDTNKITVLCGTAPQPVVDRVTGEHRTNREGQALFRTEVIVLGTGRPEVFGVRTATPPKPLVVGAPLVVSDLTVSTFTAKDGGTGVFYEATSIEPAKNAREVS